MSASRRGRRPAAEALTLLDALARAPAAAALVAHALERPEDRKALRLSCSQLRDAADEATTKMRLVLPDAASARLLTAAPQRWPCLRELSIFGADLAVFEALGSGTWAALRTLGISLHDGAVLDVPSARALAAALQRMPALRALELWRIPFTDASAAELFRTSDADGAPHLRMLSINVGYGNSATALSLAAVRMLAASGWRLEELRLRMKDGAAAAGVAALIAAPTFVLRRLRLSECGLDAASLLSLADAPWPLEELGLSGNDFSAAAAGPALAALSRLAGLRRLDVGHCNLTVATFAALVGAVWPMLTHLSAPTAFETRAVPTGVLGTDACTLGPDAFAAVPALEFLDLSHVPLGEAAAQLLASRRWACLQELNLYGAFEGGAGVAALARGEWPVLRRLNLCGGGGPPLTREPARRWAPALAEASERRAPAPRCASVETDSDSDASEGEDSE